MIKIFLCSEDMKHRKQYRTELEHLSITEDIPADIHMYGDPEQLSELIEVQPERCDILYLDMEFENTDGIRLAEQLRAFGYEGELIFLLENSRSLVKNMQNAFDVRASNCIIRGTCSMERRRSVFCEAVKRVQNRQDDYIAFRNKGEQKYIALSDISHFEVENRIITVYFGERESFRFYSTMEKLEGQLTGKGFLRIHRSYLINPRRVVSSTKETITTDNGYTMPVGRSFWQVVREELRKTYGTKEETLLWQ